MQASVAWGTGAERLATRTTPQGRDEGCGVPWRVGTVRQWEQATTAAVAAPVADAHPSGREHAVAHLDATRGRHGDKRAWLWVAVTSGVTGWGVRRARGAQVAQALCGETCAGLLVTERSRADTGYPVRWRQRCWAQLLREGEAIRGRGGPSAARGAAVPAQAHPRVPWWHRVRDGTRHRASFRSSLSPRRRAVER